MFRILTLIPAMAASSHGPKAGGPVEHNPVPPPLPVTRRRTRSMAADESVADENARFALVARPLTDHQGDEACDDPQGGEAHTYLSTRPYTDQVAISDGDRDRPGPDSQPGGARQDVRTSTALSTKLMHKLMH